VAATTASTTAPTTALLFDTAEPAEAVAPAPAAQAPSEVAPAPAVAVAPAPAAVAKPFVLVPEELTQIAQSAGLEWVQSDAAKVQQVQQAIAAEPAPVRVPREPKPPVQVEDGPLVLVETRRDLRNMTLPF
jgi:ribonuclease E